MKRLLIALLLLYPVSALAETYEWTDSQGTVHFTEDLGKVPKKYRKRVKTVGEEDGGPQTTVTTEPVKKEGKVKEAEKGPKLYGGKDEGTWRSAFRSANNEVERLDSELATLQGRMADTSKMSRGEYLTIQNTIKHTEVRLKDAQRKLELLNESADRAGVPAEFRK